MRWRADCILELKAADVDDEPEVRLGRRAPGHGLVVRVEVRVVEDVQPRRLQRGRDLREGAGGQQTLAHSTAAARRRTLSRIISSTGDPDGGDDAMAVRVRLALGSPRQSRRNMEGWRAGAECSASPGVFAGPLPGPPRTWDSFFLGRLRAHPPGVAFSEQWGSRSRSCSASANTGPSPPPRMPPSPRPPPRVPIVFFPAIPNKTPVAPPPLLGDASAPQGQSVWLATYTEHSVDPPRTGWRLLADRSGDDVFRLVPRTKSGRTPRRSSRHDASLIFTSNIKS